MPRRGGGEPLAGHGGAARGGRGARRLRRQHHHRHRRGEAAGHGRGGRQAHGGVGVSHQVVRRGRGNGPQCLRKGSRARATHRPRRRQAVGGPTVVLLAPIDRRGGPEAHSSCRHPSSRLSLLSKPPCRAAGLRATAARRSAPPRRTAPERRTPTTSRGRRA